MLWSVIIRTLASPHRLSSSFILRTKALTYPSSSSCAQSTIKRVCSPVYDSYHHHHLDVDPNSLTHDQVLNIVASLASDAGSMVAPTFFNWAIASSKFRHLTRLYILCPTSLIENKNFEKVYDVLQCTVKIFADAMRVKETMEMVIEMHNQGLVPSTKTLNWVFKILSEMELELVEYAENLFDEMCVRGVQPNCVSYRVMVVGYCKVGTVLEEDSWLSAMIEREFCDEGIVVVDFVRWA